MIYIDLLKKKSEILQIEDVHGTYKGIVDLMSRLGCYDLNSEGKC